MFIALGIGSILGFISAVPVAGPVSALILKYGLKEKYAFGRWLAFGAAASESLYVFIAFWSFDHFLSKFKFILIASNGVAVGILSFLGIYFIRSKSLRSTTHSHKRGTDQEGKAFFTGAGVSAANPSLIATWTAAATSLYSSHLFEFTMTNYLLFSVGVCIGIVCWFLLMLRLIAKHKDQFQKNTLDKALKGFGVFLLVLSSYLAVKMVLEIIHR